MVAKKHNDGFRQLVSDYANIVEKANLRLIMVASNFSSKKKMVTLGIPRLIDIVERQI